jgi:polyvinyl alcohol dehydrogenase (cytochrome)
VAGGNSVRSSSVYYLNEGGGHTALVLAGDIYGNFYAVNAVTGNLVWSHFLGTDRKHHFITGGMQFYGGKLFVPVASKEVITTIVELQDCCRSHGMLQAINPYTGTIYWTYNTSERASYQPSTGKKAPNGMSIWGTPAIDPARNTVYIGTGQNLSPPTTRNSDSVIALDMDTGNEKWVFQGNVGDAYNAGCELKPPLNVDCVDPKGPDWDFGAPPILVHLAGGKDAVIAGEKSGVVYSLDPDTGAVNWSHKLGAGGALGGIHWGMATDGTNVYAAVSDVTVDKASALSYIFKNSEITQVPDATPGIYALKLSNGQLVWEVHPQHTYKGQQYPSIYSAALSVTNDVLFAGSLDGVLKAFRTSDGAELWSYDTTAPFTDPDGNSGHGGTIDSVGAVPAGSDLLVNSGYSTFGSPGPLQYGGGNALLVMRLPGA